MPLRTARILAVMLISAHLLLVLAYTLPRAWVPDRLFFMGQRHVRPLFQQQWNLFAPDPWLCERRVEVGLADGTWRPLTTAEDSYVYRRMTRPLAELVATDVQQGHAVLMPRLAAILRGAARDTGREVPDLRYRLVQRCITNPARPQERVESVIELQLPPP